MKTITKITLSTIIVLTSILTYGQHSKVSVEISNIDSEEGVILVALFDSEANFLKKAVQRDQVDAKNGTVNVSFDNVKAGTFAVSVIHDENNNGGLDTNMMGIPSEPYGVSMDGKNMFGPPSYDKAKFEVADKNVDLKITL